MDNIDLEHLDDQALVDLLNVLKGMDDELVNMIVEGDGSNE
jgi:hypothetical protein